MVSKSLLPETNQSAPKPPKIYCYEKITLKDISEVKPKVEELTEKFSGGWRCKFCGFVKGPGSHRKQELGGHIESHFDGSDCPGLHGLKQQKLFGVCDVCRKSITRDNIVYGCRKCNWDACESCYVPKMNAIHTAAKYSSFRTLKYLVLRTMEDQMHF